MLNPDTCIFYAGNKQCLYTYDFGGCKYRAKPKRCICEGKPKDLAVYRQPEELKTVQLQKLGGVL